MLLLVANVILQVKSYGDFFMVVRQILGRSFFIGDFINLSALNWLRQDAVVLGIGLLLVLAVSIGKEKNVNILAFIDHQVLPVRWLIYYILLFGILLFGMYGSQYDAGQFLYMQF